MSQLQGATSDEEVRHILSEGNSDVIYDSGFSTPISLKTHADLMRPLFVSSVTPLTAEEMTAIFHIDYSLPG